MNTIRKHSRIVLGLLLVVLSLVLISVVGYAQALKSYQQQTRDAIMAQTEVARIGIEQILSSGVPLHDIAGLQKVLSPIADADASVVDLRLVSGEHELYRYTNKSIDGNLITIPLNNKFTQVGALEVMLSDEQIKRKIESGFSPLVWVVLLLIAAFTVAVLNSKNSRAYFSTFSLIFLSMAVAVMLLVGGLLKEGLENKATSMANIISQRLAPVLQIGVDPKMVSGLDNMLTSFRDVNDELATISVFRGSELIATTGDAGVSLSFEGIADYTFTDSETNEVSLSFHAEVLLGQLLKVLKSFVILFGGCAFVCFAFIRLLSIDDVQSDSDRVLDRIKPLLLMTVLMEALMAPILPQYLESVATQAGLAGTFSSWFFAVYFIGFTLTLLPASRLAEVFDSRKVLITGIVISALGCLALATNSDVFTVLAARLASGIGQAIIFITVQGYILRFSDHKNKTQATGIIVFCFNAGFISGAAIGSLLADFLGSSGIFALSALVGAAMTFFCMLLPGLQKATKEAFCLTTTLKTVASDSVRFLKIPSFLRTMLLVGIPAKVVLTGVVFFAVPLMLSEKGVPKESIGQVLMAYALAVLFVSGRVAPVIDKLGGSKTALCASNVIAAIALILLGFGFSLPAIFSQVSVITGAMLVLGVAHGLVNAPVVTHVVSYVSGENETTVAATYRFIERIGHVMGSIVVGYLIAHAGNSLAFVLLAAFFITAAVLMFFFENKKLVEVQS